MLWIDQIYTITVFVFGSLIRHTRCTSLLTGYQEISQWAKDHKVPSFEISWFRHQFPSMKFEGFVPPEEEAKA